MLGGVYWPEYERYIDNLKPEQVNAHLKNVFKKEPTVVVQGKNA